MRSKKHDERGASADGVFSPEDVEAAVRAAARGIVERHKEYPSPDQLAEGSTACSPASSTCSLSAERSVSSR